MRVIAFIAVLSVINTYFGSTWGYVIDSIKNVKNVLEASNFVSLKDDLQNALAAIYHRPCDNLMTYGIPFLDDALLGLANDEVVLIGAPSGIGKTEYCIRLALANIARGYNVHFFSLESSKHEIATRYMYTRVAEMYFNDPERPQLAVRLNYLHFYYGKYENKLDKYKEILFAENGLDKLKIYYKNKDFGIDHFLRAVDGVSNKTDLIIVDHIHYFDMEKDNENREMKEIIKKIRVRSQILNKPIVLIAHLRKKSGFQRRLVAELDDFHGSSDIGKISTTAILMGPGKALGKGRYETFFRIVKCRKAGGLKYYTIKCIYDSFRNAYSTYYQVGKEVWSKEGPFFEPIQSNNELPYWAPKLTTQSFYPE